MTSMFLSPPKRTTRAGTKLIDLNGKKSSNDQSSQLSLNETFPKGDALSGDLQTGTILPQIVEGAGAGGPPTDQNSDTTVLIQRAVSAIPKTINRGGTPVGRGRGSRGATPTLNENPHWQSLETTLGTLTTRLNHFDAKWARVETLENKIDLLLQNLNISNNTETNNNIEIPLLNLASRGESAAGKATMNSEMLNHAYSSDEEDNEVEVSLINTELSKTAGNGQQRSPIDINKKIQLLYQNASRPPRERLANFPGAFVPYRRENGRGKTVNVEPSNSSRNIDKEIRQARQNTRGLSREISLGPELLDNYNNLLTNNSQAASYRRIDTVGAESSNNLNDTAWPRSSGTRWAHSLSRNADTLDLRGSVDGGTRRVNFRTENLINGRHRSPQFMDAEQSNRRVDRLIIAEMTPEGELVTRENVTNEEYRRLIQNRLEAERDEIRTPNLRSRREQQSPVRRGVLSWRSSESDDSDDNIRGADGYQHARARRNASSTSRYGGRENNSPAYAYDRELESAMKIGRIVRDWKITFPKTVPADLERPVERERDKKRSVCSLPVKRFRGTV